MALRKRSKPKKSPSDSDVSIDENVHLILENIIDEIEQIEDPGTQELWADAVQTFARTGDVSMLLAATEWRRKIVPIDEFLFSETFLGMDEAETFPSVKEACYELDSDHYVEAVLKGAIGTGKTTISNAMLGRAIYKLSCMRHPQTTLGIQSKSSIVFTIQSVRYNTAKKAVFDEFGQYINTSPYFKHVYPYDHKVTSSMIFREQNVTILPVASGATGAISMNVLGGILDEVNFMQKIEKSKSSYADETGEFDQAKQLYNTLSRRRRSRFTKKGQLPGTLFLVSSSRFPDDFTEQKAAEAKSEGGDDDQIYVYSHSQWSAKPRSNFMKEEFSVMIGNERVQSKILADGERPKPGCEVINVPMDFRKEFDKDIDGSLRDYAGMTTLSTTPFITRRDVINEAMELGKGYGYQNPFNLEEVDLSLGTPKPYKDRLLLDVPSFRTCHVDLGLKKDAAGLAIGHVAGAKVIERENPETGATELEVLPVIGIDVALRIVPPPGGEIEFAKIRELLFMLRDRHKLDIKYLTFDGFQSVDSRQIMRKQGFQTDYLSVEKIEPYRALRDTMYDGRLILPPQQFLAKELAELEVVTSNNKEKVDHRPNGTKDVCDAVCGVVSFLLKRRAAWANLSLSRQVGVHLFRDFQDIKEEDEKGDDSKRENKPNRLGKSGTNRVRVERKRVQRKRLSRK